jgi:hypothetical protein
MIDFEKDLSKLSININYEDIYLCKILIDDNLKYQKYLQCSNKEDLNKYVYYIQQSLRELNMSNKIINLKSELIKINDVKDINDIKNINNINKEKIQVKEDILIEISKKRGELIELLRKINYELLN